MADKTRENSGGHNAILSDGGALTQAEESWRLVGVAQDPTSQGVLVVWDTSGFISG